MHSAEKALERDYFMTAQESLDFGIIDKIVDRRAKDEPEGEAPGNDKEKSETAQ